MWELKRARWMAGLAMGVSATVWTLTACGGGGGGASEASQPLRAETQGATVVTEVPQPCGTISLDCLFNARVLISSNGEFSALWREVGSDGRYGWRAASVAPGESSVRSRVTLAADSTTVLAPMDLGNRRFAALSVYEPELASWVFDLSGAPQGQASARTGLGLDNSATLINGMDGAFVLGASVTNGTVDLGGSVSAPSVQLQLPAALRNLWPGSVAPAKSLTPAAWWAFAAAPQSSPEQRVYLASVQLPGGDVEFVEERSTRPLRLRGGGPDPCVIKPTVEVLAPGAAAVVWVENNASATGCDVVVDGVAVNDPAASALMPAVSGSPEGLVAVWLERNPSPPTQYSSRLVWRRRDSVTGQWSPITSFSSGPISTLMGYASGPGGTMAVAWSDCGSFAGSCRPFLSKYVHGAWTTVPFENPSGGGTAVAINAQGDAVAVWLNNTGWACTNDASKTCNRVIARRF